MSQKYYELLRLSSNGLITITDVKLKIKYKLIIFIYTTTGGVVAMWLC